VGVFLFFNHEWTLDFFSFFVHLLRLLCEFLIFILLMWCINLFAYIESSLNPTDEPLVIVYKPSNLLLNSVCWYFAEDVFIHVH
jgi:hypothetical protein